MFTLSEVERWKPWALVEFGRRINQGSADFTAALDRTCTLVRAAETDWSGASYRAAYERFGTNRDAGKRISHHIDHLGDVMVRGGEWLVNCRDDLLRQVANAAADGLPIGYDWTGTPLTDGPAAPAPWTDRAATSEISERRAAVTAAYHRLSNALDEVRSEIALATEIVRKHSHAIPGEQRNHLRYLPFQRVDDNRTVYLETGDTNDEVRIVEGPAANTLSVTVTRSGPNGPISEIYAVDGTEVDTLVLKTQGGDDTVQLEQGTSAAGVRFRVITGTGSDRIRAGEGSGDKYVDAGSGDDEIIVIDGRNILYGGPGVDTITGGVGHEYIDGGRGNDTIAGGAGNDIVFGGTGDDTIEGGGGDDRIFTGAGRDIATGGWIDQSGNAGIDAIFQQRGEDTIASRDHSRLVDVTIAEVPGNIEISGGLAPDLFELAQQVPDFRTHVESTPSGRDGLDPTAISEWKAHVESDLEALAATSTGGRLLAEIAEFHHIVYISPGTEQVGNVTLPVPSVPDQPPDSPFYYDAENARPRGGTSSRILYDPTSTDLSSEIIDDWGWLPPPLTLSHELGHARQFGDGTMPPGIYNGSRLNDVGSTNAEPDVIGLTITQDGPSGLRELHTPWSRNKPTENGFREELGLPPRTSNNGTPRH